MIKVLAGIILALLAALLWQIGDARAARADLGLLQVDIEQAMNAAAHNAAAARDAQQMLDTCIGDARAIASAADAALARMAAADAARAQAERDAVSARAELAARDPAARDFFAQTIADSVTDRWRAAL